jgi:hypothetical protein
MRTAPRSGDHRRFLPASTPALSVLDEPRDEGEGMTDGIYIEGMDRILAKFPGFRPAVVAALKAGAVHVKGKIAKYPPCQ